VKTELVFKLFLMNFFINNSKRMVVETLEYKSIKYEVKGALRYPGGKTRALKKIILHIPSFAEFREPLVGGGSVFLSIKQRVPKGIKFWINDLNHNLFCFWSQLKMDGLNIVNTIQEYKDKWNNGRTLFDYLTDETKKWTEFEKAVRFFILNRITFSGVVDAGGYSKQSFRKRFTQSSIDRLTGLIDILQNVKITNVDYEKVVTAPGENVFIFLDPPYFSTTNSRLYGKNGSLHTEFNHERFSKVMKRCSHKWLITYDDSPEVRNLFDYAYQKEWTLQYGMNNYKQDSARKGNELFISNYTID
jgi:DNA adenine methylase